ncbi:hypothetical protein HY029_00710 [Candidatus Gottesmanbacteria bacterium]|nr:hypothetical protein [Candidatus Gottesmanbacteria bacterium]
MANVEQIEQQARQRFVPNWCKGRVATGQEPNLVCVDKGDGVGSVYCETTQALSLDCRKGNGGCQLRNTLSWKPLEFDY